MVWKIAGADSDALDNRVKRIEARKNASRTREVQIPKTIS